MMEGRWGVLGFTQPEQDAEVAEKDATDQLIVSILPHTCIHTHTHTHTHRKLYKTI